ncbi:MAG: response regulator [Deltaproteobacteria bacterium]|nr:response regulator [Deltaproteobacteria bacterium]TLN05154.1 MAG: response regulator [bacterium]
MGTTLLLADDSITIQKVVGIIFANEDYELVVVDNGTSALEKAREIRPDVMLVDALMPGKSGYEVCEEVRRDPQLKGIPLLLLVGAFEPFDEDKARQSGVDDHITKPFESQSLIDKVKALLVLAASRVPDVSPPKEEISPAIEADVPEEISPEIPEAMIAAMQPESPAATADTSAKLFDSFRGFVHLGSDAAKPPVAEEAVSAQPEAPEPTVPAEPEGVILLSSVDIVEATPEDDPWGTFSEVVEDGEEIHFGEVLDESADAEQEAADTVEEIEPFALMDEEPASGSFGAISLHDEMDLPGETGVSLGEVPAAAGEPMTDEVEEPVQENLTPSSSYSGSISLGDFSPVQESVDLSEHDIAEPLEVQPAEQFGFSPEYTDLPFAQEEEYLPAAEVFPADEAFPAAEEEPLPPVASATEGAVTFTEEQLAAAIAKVSREIIEKIAWEVVPDLAETLIKDEIRKIKESMGR